jgi:hypothetical protein
VAQVRDRCGQRSCPHCGAIHAAKMELDYKSLVLLLWYSFLAIVKVIFIAAFGGFFTRSHLLSSGAKKDLSNVRHNIYLFIIYLLE